MVNLTSVYSSRFKMSEIQSPYQTKFPLCLTETQQKFATAMGSHTTMKFESKQNACVSMRGLIGWSCLPLIFLVLTDAVKVDDFSCTITAINSKKEVEMKRVT